MHAKPGRGRGLGLGRQRAEVLLEVKIALVAHAEIQVNRLPRAAPERGLHDRLDGGEAGAAGERQDRPGMVLA